MNWFHIVVSVFPRIFFRSGVCTKKTLTNEASRMAYWHGRFHSDAIYICVQIFVRSVNTRLKTVITRRGWLNKLHLLHKISSVTFAKQKHITNTLCMIHCCTLSSLTWHHDMDILPQEAHLLKSSCRPPLEVLFSAACSWNLFSPTKWEDLSFI